MSEIDDVIADTTKDGAAEWDAIRSSIDGLPVGMLSPEELRLFDRAVRAGAARRRYEGMTGLMGIAKVEFESRMTEREEAQMRETDAAALRAENARLLASLTEIRQLLSYAGQDAVSPAVAQANLNAAWHEARAALAGEKEPTAFNEAGEVSEEVWNELTPKKPT